MKVEMRDSEIFDQDEVSLRDLWRILAHQKKWVVGIPILCVILSGVITFLSKPKWEATAVVQIGQINQSGAGQNLQLIEPPARAVERMKLKSFEDDVLANLKIPVTPGDQNGQLFRTSLALKALGTTDLIQIRVRGYTPDQAALWGRAVVDRISAIHQNLVRQTVERLENQLAQLNRQMHGIEEDRDKLSQIDSTSAGRTGDSKFSQELLLSNLLVQKNAELRDFEMRRLAVNEQLSTIRAYPTTLIDRVYVPEKPASPKKLLTVLLAAIVGLMLGIVVAFLRNYWQAGKNSI